jgi:hypothetical protein
MTAFMKEVAQEFSQSKALIVILWIASFVGCMEIARSMVILGMLDRNHDAIRNVTDEVDLRTADRWTKGDMLRLCEKFNERNPQCPVPLEGLK